MLLCQLILSQLGILSSILAQDPKTSKVIVDDGSTDLSCRMAQSFCDFDSRFRLLVQSENGGVIQARMALSSRPGLLLSWTLTIYGIRFSFDLASGIKASWSGLFTHYLRFRCNRCF